MRFDNAECLVRLPWSKWTHVMVSLHRHCIAIIANAACLKICSDIFFHICAVGGMEASHPDYRPDLINEQSDGLGSLNNIPVIIQDCQPCWGIGAIMCPDAK